MTRTPIGTCRGSAVALVLLLLETVAAAAMPPGHGTHPLMPGQQLALTVQWSKDGKIRHRSVPLKVPMVTAPAKLDQAIDLPESRTALRVVRYLPNAVRIQEVKEVPEGGGRPAVQLEITGPAESVTRWLTAGDPLRNRLVSLIGTWRFMAAGDEAVRARLLQQFRDELTRKPRLVVKNPRTDDEPKVLNLRVGKPQHIPEWDCTITVREFFPHYAFDDKTRKPINRSDNMRNPAAHVLVQCDDQRGEQGIFARFPRCGMHDKKPLPLQLRLDSPIAAERDVPDFALVAVQGQRVEVWIRYRGKTKVRTIKTGEFLDIADSAYRFAVRRFVSSGRLTERFEPAPSGRAGGPAIEVAYRSPDKVTEQCWLTPGRMETLMTESGAVSIRFDTQPITGMGKHPWTGGSKVP